MKRLNKKRLNSAVFFIFPAVSCLSASLSSATRYDSSSYIQDGLIVQLDGIDNAGTGVHDSSATVWKDLKGSLDFTVISGKGSWGANCFVTAGKSASAGQISTYSTVEALFQPTASANGYVFYTHTRERAIFMHPTSAALWFRTTEGVQAAIDLISYNIVHHVAATYSGNNVVAAYRDSKEVPVWNTASVWNVSGTAATIGGRANGQYGTNGKIYALRFYDRQLSEEEIFHNYAVDRARFFGDYLPICGFGVSAVEPQMFDGITVPTPEPSVVAAGGEALVKGTDFDYEYENNDRIGTATVTVVGKGEYAGKAYPVDFLVVSPKYAAAESCGNADGSSWGNAMSFADALSSVSSGDIICVKAGTIPWTAGATVSVPCRIYGGYSGDEGNPFAKEDGAKTVLDGAGSTETLLTVSVSGDVPVIIRDVGFTRAKLRAFRKTGSAELLMENCDFTYNGMADTAYAGGRGAYITGSASSTARLKGCSFRYNMATNGAFYFGNGVALNAGTLKRLYLEDCSFVGNGLAHNLYGGTTQQILYGAAVYSTVPIVASGCEFRLNHAAERNDKRGSTITLAGGTGHVFSNCTFVANSGTFMQYDGTTGGGVIRVAAGSGNTVSLERCTFAYNLSDSASCANLVVVSGAVSVRNCIFSDAIVSSRHTGGKFISVASRAKCTISDCLFPAGRESDAIRYSREQDVSIGKNVSFGGACFRTGPEEVEPHTLTSSGYLHFNPESLGELEEIDVHPVGSLGVYSAAIDQGAEEDAVGEEPSPNGGRIDLGAYGGTKEATASAPDAATIERFDLTWPDGLSFPRFDVTLGGEAGALYNADVEVFCATGAQITAGEWVSAGRVYALHRGGTAQLTHALPLVAGDDFKMRAVVYNGAERVTKEITGTVEGSLPAWSGKGGGDGVIHVWTDALYEETGRDWGGAYRSLAAALAAWEPSKSEIWIAGTNVVKSSIPQFSPTSSVVIRGGFTGVENDAGERPENSYAQLDGLDDASTIFTLVNSAAATVTVERVEFYRAYVRALKKTGAGRIELSGCRFVNNARNTCNNDGGYGASLTGTAAAEALVTNCLFEGHIYNAQSGGEHNNGRAMYAKTFSSLEIVDTRFIYNGAGLTSTTGSTAPNRNSCGTTLCIEGAPAVLRRCDFRANGGTVGGEHQPSWGGVVSIGGASGGSIVENCLFLGNCDMLGGAANTQSTRSGSGGGALVFRLADSTTSAKVKNCTFAFNLCDALSSAAGLTVQKGNVAVENCIFHSNVTGGGTLVASDVAFAADGAGSVDYSMFDSGVLSCVSAAGEEVSIDENSCRMGDPLFAVTNDIASLIVSEGLTYFRRDEAVLDDLLALDAHIRSSSGYVLDDGTSVDDDDVVSPAIDGGDPLDDYSREPFPHGWRVNMGRYGNTCEASKSTVGQPTVESVDVAFKDGWSQPTVSVLLGGEAQSYSATVSITLITNGVEAASADVAGVSNGGTAAFTPVFYLEPGSDLVVKVYVTAAGAEAVVPDDVEMKVESSLPPWYGKGGDSSKVIHVRKGATGKGDGTSWTDAYTDIATALGNVGGGLREIWLSGSFDLTVSLALNEGIMIRGGFDGSENTPSERKDGAVTSLHGGNIADTIVTAANPAGETVTLDSLALVRAYTRALKKTGAGDLVMTGCLVATNGLTVCNVDGGYGIHVNGAGAASLIVSNCIFRNQTFGTQCSGGINDGGAIKAVSCAKVVVVGSQFVRNGASPTAEVGAIHPYRNSSGRAVYVKDSVLSMRESAIVGNRGTSGYDSDPVCGGTLVLLGKCGGSEIINCSFLGNANDFGHAGGSQSSHSTYGGGALVLRLTDATHTAKVENCTFAWNISDTYKSAAGVSVVSGYADIRNCVFSRNLTGSYTLAGKDVSFADGAEGAVAFALFDDALSSCVSAEGEGVVILTNTFRFGDALFVSTNRTDDLVTKGTLLYFKRTLAAQEALEALDCRLRSHIGFVDAQTGERVRYYGERSPAIDGGDPSSDWSRERDLDFGTHGRRVNLGAYGNTPEAALSPVSGSILFLR